MQIKKFEAKITKVGNSLMLVVPAWVNKAFDVQKGEIIEVQLEKVKKESENTGLHNAPIVYSGPLTLISEIA